MLNPHKLLVIMNMKRFNKYNICSRCNLKQRDAYTCSRMQSYTHIYIFRDSHTNIGSTRILTDNKFRHYLWAY